MSTEVKTPKPSKAEKKLKKEQQKLLKQQKQIVKKTQKQQEALLPFFAAQAGLEIELNKKGNIKSITEKPETAALNAQDQEIQRLLNERSLAALKGELPVDPVLERELEKQEQTLRERLQGQFGAGYETSSPAIETLDEFFRSAEGLRYNARRGELTLAEQLGLARRESEASQDTTLMNMLRGSAIGDPLSFANAFGSIASGYAQAQQPYQFDRSMQFQANLQNAQNQMAMLGGLGNLAGTMFGAVFPGA